MQTINSDYDEFLEFLKDSSFQQKTGSFTTTSFSVYVYKLKELETDLDDLQLMMLDSSVSSMKALRDLKKQICKHNVITRNIVQDCLIRLLTSANLRLPFCLPFS